MEYTNAKVPALLEELRTSRNATLQALYAAATPRAGVDVPLLTSTQGNTTVQIPLAQNDWFYARMLPSGLFPVIQTTRERSAAQFNMPLF